MDPNRRPCTSEPCPLGRHCGPADKSQAAGEDREQQFAGIRGPVRTAKDALSYCFSPCFLFCMKRDPLMSYSVLSLLLLFLCLFDKKERPIYSLLYHSGSPLLSSVRFWHKRETYWLSPVLFRPTPVVAGSVSSAFFLHTKKELFAAFFPIQAHPCC